jgi:hypothetical protein
MCPYLSSEVCLHVGLIAAERNGATRDVVRSDRVACVYAGVDISIENCALCKYFDEITHKDVEI